MMIMVISSIPILTMIIGTIMRAIPIVIVWIWIVVIVTWSRAYYYTTVGIC